MGVVEDGGFVVKVSLGSDVAEGVDGDDDDDDPLEVAVVDESTEELLDGAVAEEWLVADVVAGVADVCVVDEEGVAEETARMPARRSVVAPQYMFLVFKSTVSKLDPQ